MLTKADFGEIAEQLSVEVEETLSYMREYIARHGNNLTEPRQEYIYLKQMRIYRKALAEESQPLIAVLNYIAREAPDGD